MTANGGTITLGDAGTDNVTIGGEINSDIIPDATNTYDLGSSSKKWAEIHATTFTGNITGNVTGNVTGNTSGSSGSSTGNAATATVLATGRTVAMTGDGTWNSGSFNGSANVTAAMTLANSGVTATSYGSATAIPIITVDAKGRITTATTAAVSSDMAMAGDSGTGTITVGTDTFTVAGGTGIATSVSGDTITVTATSDPTITLAGAVTGSGTMTNLGNVSITTTATADPTITLAGDLSGAVTLTNLGNGTLTATIADDSVGASELGSTIGTATALKALVVNSSKDIDLGSGDLTATIVTASLTGNVTGNVAGNVTGNVVGDVTGDVTGNADTATKLAATKTIGMTGDVVWTSAGFDGSGNVTGTAAIQANSVALGTDTTGNYMSNVSAGTGVIISHTPAEGSTGTVAIGQSVATSAEPSFDGLTITGNDFVTIPSGTNSQRGSPSTGSIRYSSTDSTFEGYNGSAWGSLGGVKDVDGDTYITAETSSGSDQDVLTLVAGGTTGLTVSATTTTVAGNLIVSGTTTTINTETINLADNTILLNSNEAGTPSQDSGIEVERGTSTNKTFVWDETNDKWTVGSETLVAGTFEGTITAANVSGLSSEVSTTVLTIVDPDFVASNSTTAYNTADWGNLTSGSGTVGFVNEPVRATTYQDLAMPGSTITVDFGALA
jgi:hypothetical protein